MTHEQKPESAEFRTREAQPWNGYPDHPEIDGFHWLRQTGCGRLIPFEWVSCDEHWLFDDNSDGFPDETAGMFSYHGPCSPPEVGKATEQRRKDAEGAEPVAYRWAYNVPRGRDSLWHFGGDLPEPRPERPEPKHVTPLYTRPANVAALEDRVKELEGENKAWSGAATNALTWLENGRQANARDELKAAQRRVAALREGGEHG